MTVLRIEALKDKSAYQPFIDRCRTLQKERRYQSIPERNWILATLLPKKKLSILDIGSCQIVFKELLESSQTQQYEYHTLDVTPVENKPDWVNEHIHDCNVSGYPVPDNHFDLIICSDVIEHIRNHEVLLNECKKKLNSNGALFLTTPNYSSGPNIRNILSGKMFHDPCGSALERYCFNEHVRYFTTLSLIPYLQQQGLYASHLLLHGLATEIPGRGPLFRLCMNFFYNRLCTSFVRYSHQTILILQKNAMRYRKVHCPLIKVI